MQTNQYHMATRPLRRATEALLLLAVIAGCANMQPTQPLVHVPDKLKAGADETLAMIVPARGVQIYECGVNNADPARFEWIFKAPEAELFDQAGNRIGKHYAGPTWESDDGSKVVGAAKARDDGPDANAIPWLLLSATSAEGDGIFGKTQNVQRVRTVGGKAPADGCNQAQLGKVARVSYSATYNFYVARP